MPESQTESDQRYAALMADLRDVLANETVEAYTPAVRFNAVSASRLSQVLARHDALNYPPATTTTASEDR